MKPIDLISHYVCFYILTSLITCFSLTSCDKLEVRFKEEPDNEIYSDASLDRDEYITAAKRLLQTMATPTKAYRSMCDEIMDRWQSAIRQGHTPDYALQEQMASYQRDGVFEKLKLKEQNVQKYLNALHPPPEMEALHQKIISYYSTYTELRSLALEPSGSYITFLNRVQKVDSDLTRQKSELDLFLK